MYYIVLFAPLTDFDQTKHIRHCPRCVEGACALGRGLPQPQAEQLAKAAGYHGWPIILAYCVTRRGYLPYVGPYIGIAQNSTHKNLIPLEVLQKPVRI